MSSEEKMKVTVKLFGGIGNFAGISTVSVLLPPHAAISEALKELYQSHSALQEKLEKGVAEGYINIIVNGRNIRFLGRYLPTALLNQGTRSAPHYSRGNARPCESPER